VTRRFHKTKFRRFFSEKELVDFLQMLWRHFCQILLRKWKRILFTLILTNGQNFSIPRVKSQTPKKSRGIICPDTGVKHHGGVPDPRSVFINRKDIDSCDSNLVE
jgi:hypothetical protein